MNSQLHHGHVITNMNTQEVSETNAAELFNKHDIKVGKNMKSLKRCAVTFLHPLLFLLLCGQVYSQDELNSCQSSEQRHIYSTMPSCKPRPTLIDLRPPFANHSEVIQVVPDHLMLKRCGGSCYVPSHSCSPTIRSFSKVNVMLVLSKWPHGEHEMVCSEIELEEHEECECGCRVRSEDCHPVAQYYHPPSCRYKT